MIEQNEKTTIICILWFYLLISNKTTTNRPSSDIQLYCNSTTNKTEKNYQHK